MDKTALFAEIQQGLNITKNLKHLSKEEKLRRKEEGKALVGNVEPVARALHVKQEEKPKGKPVFELVGREWHVENQYNGEITIHDVNIGQIVQLRNCVNFTVTVVKKVSAILLNECKSVNLVFSGCLSGVDVVSCREIKLQILEGSLPTLTVDQTSGGHYYLNKESRHVKVNSSSITGNNLWFPSIDGNDGDFVCKPIPEHFTTIISPDKDDLITKVSDLYLEQ